MNFIYLLLSFYFLCYSCHKHEKDKISKISSTKKIQDMDTIRYQEYLKMLNIKPDTFNKKKFDKDAEFGKFN